jgi:hypothetical protein
MLAERGRVPGTGVPGHRCAWIAVVAFRHAETKWVAILLLEDLCEILRPTACEVGEGD